MKISVSKKSSVILYFILLSTVSFGLFFSFHFVSNPGLQGEQTLSHLEGDTIPPRKSDPSDSVYRTILVTADNYLTQKAYEKSLAELKKAQLIKPNDPLLKEKIFKLNGLIANQKQQFETSQKSVVSGDAYFKNKDYLNAKSAYQLAVSQNADDTIARERLKKTLDLLRSQKAQNILFDVAIAGADKLFQAGDYVKAQQEYENASKLLPGDPYPKSKINEIIKIQVDRQVRDEDYAKAIVLADKFYAGKNYQDALLNYKKAGTLNPDEKYPQEKIKELTQLIADMKAKDEAYNKAIGLADISLASTRYTEAMKSYRDALVIKPEQVYPSNKIKEIEGILAKIAKAQADYDQYIVLADSFYIGKQYLKARDNYQMGISAKPGESYPKQMMTKAEMMMTGQEAAMARLAEEQYAKAISTGDKLLVDKAYAQAKLQYQEALKIKAAEQYPKDKITEIDKVMADLGLLKDRDTKYAAAIANGDKLLLQKSYAPARAEYTNASSIKPEESYPKEKMAAIDKILADLAEARALEDKYTGIIVAADKLLAAKTYDQARAEYQKAGEVKPDAAYPKEKMAAIDKILSDLAALKSLDENYKAGIAKADQYLADKSYDLARAEYAKASGLKPAEQYPKTKITEIDGILAAIAKQKALDDEYAADISNGDKLLADKSYDQAMAEYKKAAALKTAEQYPKTKLAEIEKVMTEAARLKAIDNQYNAAITAADKLLQDKAYDQAKSSYLDAGKIKPSEQYPKEKVTEINGLLAAIAKQKSIDDQYKLFLSKADALLDSKTYDQAKLEYLNAGKLKPDEQYTKDKIAEIDAVMAEMKAKEDAYKASIANADQLLVQKKYEDARTEYQNAIVIKPQATYPKEKIAEINKALEELLGKQKYYENLITAADNLLKEKDYAKALESYQQALTLFPSQTYPKEQIGLISARVDSLYRANKSFYDKAIADGDRFYNLFEFDKAVDAYNEAANFLPMEKYPREMIVKIRRTIAENAIADVMKTTVVIASNTEKQFPFSPVNIASRKNNFIYIKIKNLSNKPFNILMRYGKDKQANGGVVMRNLSSDGKVNERLVSVRDQDLWSREDNNWISLYPQGGDVEVSFIQVSRAK